MTTKTIILVTLSSLLFAACTQTTPSQPEVMMKNAQPTQTMAKNPTGLMQKTSYIAYSPEVYAQSKDQKRVLFFKANWCPTCNTADKEFMDKVSMIPEGLTLYQVDYDKETDLKKKYAVTYQHTFVQVDSLGNEVAKWNGGGVDKLLSSIK